MSLINYNRKNSSSSNSSQSYTYQLNNNFYCNVKHCRKCHPEQKRLTQREILQIKNLAIKKNAPPKQKDCNNKCNYCATYTQKIDQKIAQYCIDNSKKENAIPLHNNTTQQNQQITQTNTIVNSTASPIRQQFRKITVDDENNSLYISILNSMNIPAQYANQLKIHITNLISQIDIPQHILQTLNYNNINEFKNQIKINGNETGYETLMILAIYYNIQFQIYIEKNEYRNNHWITIKNEDTQIKETYYLSLQQGCNPYRNLQGNYSALINTNDISPTASTMKSTLEALKLNMNLKYEPDLTTINIMIWNAKSIIDYTKKAFLIQQIREHDIHIACIQETMLTENDRLHIRGYKTYRANAQIHRKGVLTIISKNIDAQSYITHSDPDGRYLKIKIKKPNTDDSITLSNIYLEPNSETNYDSIIPLQIKTSDIIVGDMNNATTNLNKINRVYHYTNNLKIKDEIKIPMQLSDHNIILGTIQLPFKIINEKKKTNIISSQAATMNNQQLFNIIKNNNFVPSFTNPIKEIYITKDDELTIDNNDYIQEYNLIKQQNLQTLTENKQKQLQILTKLLKQKQLGKQPFIRLNNILQMNKTSNYWTPENIEQKSKIIEGFKELYKANAQETIHKTQLVNTIIKIKQITNQYEQQLKSTTAPQIPYSNAKDKYGFSQKTIMKYIKSQNHFLTMENYYILIKQTLQSQTSSLFFHNYSKLILKKKKDNIQTYADLRGISIMPAWQMILDKLLYPIIHKQTIPAIAINQYGSGNRIDITAAKINIMHNAKKHNLSKILLIDIKKAFDTVDRQILQQKIKELPNSCPKDLLTIILNLYNNINIEIQDTAIHPQRGIPQGSVYGTLFFLIYINDILKKNTQNNNTNIQAYIDDIVIQAKDISTLQQTFNNIYIEIKKLKLEINTQKCQLITNQNSDFIKNPETDEEIPTTLTATYLGQQIDYLGNTINNITQQQLGTITNLIHNNAQQLSILARIKLFKLYIRSKFQHLIPMITLTGNLQQTWTNIRKTIFKQVLTYNTMPREASTLFGCSYYNIIIKPLYKLINKYQQNNQSELVQTIQDSIKPALLTWLKAEPNLTTEIKNLINEALNNKQIPLDTWESNIKLEAAQRLYKNRTIPPEIVKLTNLKLPMLIYLLSNAPTHIIYFTIKNNFKNLNNNKQIIKKIKYIIAQYYTIIMLKEYAEPYITKPDIESIDSIIEYQELYELHIDVIFNKIKTKINQNANETALEQILVNSYLEDSEQTSITHALQLQIENAQNIIIHSNQEKQEMLERAIELLNEVLQQEDDDELYEQKVKKGPGRPTTKNSNKIKNQSTIETFIKKKE